jgi:hypothetical protein
MYADSVQLINLLNWPECKNKQHSALPSPRGNLFWVAIAGEEYTVSERAKNYI